MNEGMGRGLLVLAWGRRIGKDRMDGGDGGLRVDDSFLCEDSATA